MKSSRLASDLPYCAPGLSSFSPPGPAASTAEPSSDDRLNPYMPSTQRVITKVPAISSAALMICTQVVPFMPPTST